VRKKQELFYSRKGCFNAWTEWATYCQDSQRAIERVFYQLWRFHIKTSCAFRHWTKVTTHKKMVLKKNRLYVIRKFTRIYKLVELKAFNRWVRALQYARKLQRVWDSSHENPDLIASIYSQRPRLLAAIVNSMHDKEGSCLECRRSFTPSKFPQIKQNKICVCPECNEQPSSTLQPEQKRKKKVSKFMEKLQQQAAVQKKRAQILKIVTIDGFPE